VGDEGVSDGAGADRPGTIDSIIDENDEGTEEEGDDEDSEGTEQVEMDPTAMKVGDIREALAARGWGTDGLKPDLVTRWI
jgi:hypothetical protein